jgi:Zn-dependent protease
MVFLSVQEIIDIIAMTFAIGFIFSRFFHRKPSEGYDPLTYYQKSSLWEDIKHGAMIAAPAVVLHELAHKFVAMSFGATATLHAPYTMYFLVILLTLIRFPLIFFVGGYVSHTPLPALQSSIVSIAGPLTNLVLFGLATLLVKRKLVHRKYYEPLALIAKLNLFLLAFNMIPFPGFDGYHFFRGLIAAFF